MQNGTPIAPESQNPSQEQAQQLIGLYTQGSLEEASLQASELLRSFPHCSFLYNILGAAQVGLGQLDAAIASYAEALKIEPNDAKTYFNMGNALSDKGDLDAAIECYRKAIEIQPGYALAYNNMANALKDAGQLVQAIATYRRALEIDPDHAQLYCNLGNAQKDRGELEQAIGSYRQALRLDPDYAEAYNNMGTALKDRGEIEQAVASYEQALRIQPGYADAAWNRVGTAANIDEAQAWVQRCLELDPNYLDARLALCALQYFRGDRQPFDEMMASSLRDHPALRSLAWVTGLPALPQLHFNRWAFFDSVIQRSDRERPFYEFGVFTGEAFRYLIKSFQKGFGFDTFEGLPEDWHDERAGSYSSGGAIPEIAGGEFVVGKFDDSLPIFFSEPRPVASLINFDADLYSSTISALNHSKSIIDRRTILIFDEFIVNEHWEQDEYRALQEFCAANDYRYEVLAVSFFTKQVAVRLTSI